MNDTTSSEGGPDRRTAGDAAADAAAVVSLAIGAALVVAPATTGRVLGVAPDRGVLRAVGLLDLALVPGLWFGRPRSPWLVARGLSNPLVAVVAARKARSRRAVLLAVGLLVATAVDLRAAAELRAAGR